MHKLVYRGILGNKIVCAYKQS